MSKFKLKFLKRLFLTHTKINELPSKIGELQLLEEIKLLNNNLTYYPIFDTLREEYPDFNKWFIKKELGEREKENFNNIIIILNSIIWNLQ